MVSCVPAAIHTGLVVQSTALYARVRVPQCHQRLCDSGRQSMKKIRLNRNRLVPKNMKAAIIPYEDAGVFYRRNKKFRQAEREFRKILALIEAKELSLKRPLHKGAVYYNISLTLFSQNKIQQAIRYLRCAYDEDLLTYRNLDDANKQPAWKLVQQLLATSVGGLLRGIK